MKKIIAINASPRTGWNTATLVREAARGAETEGAEVKVIDLYSLDRFAGCISCFGCKLPASLGKCVYQDALAPVLADIRKADGLILGTPNYLGEASAGFRALYERLVFQYITYKMEPRSYNTHLIPVLFIMTSNAPETFYTPEGYGRVVYTYQNTWRGIIGTTKTLIASDTLQVNDYDKYDWTMFDPEAKKARHETVFPEVKQKAFNLGVDMAKGQWE